MPAKPSDEPSASENDLDSDAEASGRNGRLLPRAHACRRSRRHRRRGSSASAAAATKLASNSSRPLHACTFGIAARRSPFPSPLRDGASVASSFSRRSTSVHKPDAVHRAAARSAGPLTHESSEGVRRTQTRTRVVATTTVPLTRSPKGKPVPRGRPRRHFSRSSSRGRVARTSRSTSASTSTSTRSCSRRHACTPHGTPTGRSGAKASRGASRQRTPPVRGVSVGSTSSVSTTSTSREGRRARGIALGSSACCTCTCQSNVCLASRTPGSATAQASHFGSFFASILTHS
jgi:hypothetical protein